MADKPFPRSILLRLRDVQSGSWDGRNSSNITTLDDLANALRNLEDQFALLEGMATPEDLFLELLAKLADLEHVAAMHDDPVQRVRAMLCEAVARQQVAEAQVAQLRRSRPAGPGDAVRGGRATAGGGGPGGATAARAGRGDLEPQRAGGRMNNKNNAADWNRRTPAPPPRDVVEVPREEWERRTWRDFAAGWAGARRSTPRQSSDEEAAVRDQLAAAWIDALAGIDALRTGERNNGGERDANG